MVNAFEIGDNGEKIAQEYLKNKGYKILETNYFLKTETNKKLGEIDIIAKKKDVYCFIEVKSSLRFNSENSFFRLERRVGKIKRQKILFVATHWLSKQKLYEKEWQVDVIGVLISDHDYELTHLENVFEGKLF